MGKHLPVLPVNTYPLDLSEISMGKSVSVKCLSDCPWESVASQGGWKRLYIAIVKFEMPFRCTKPGHQRRGESWLWVSGAAHPSEVG
jgi:hypothetical protein